MIIKEFCQSVLSRIQRPDHYALKAEYFPEATRNLLPLEMVLEHRVLPLGYKRKRGFSGSASLLLNLGFIEVPSQQLRDELLEFVKQSEPNVEDTIAYLVDEDAFDEVLVQHYQSQGALDSDPPTS